ncbi:phage tail protein [Pseudoalteromonas rubra]|uniref:phage tail-collar fiber domain-containing protein n=1 Tax=Pseudoalteromonas rubra TaxID=43658 RepID=UPI000F79604A|nr:phage tail protein [Pseudoalteromonas rubra]
MSELFDGHIVYTKQGLKELISAQGQGLQGRITHIAVGDQGYTPSPSQTRLYNERQREPVVDSEDLSDTQIRMAALFDGELEYSVKEIGVYLESGTLLGVYSGNGELLNFKSRNNNIIQKLTLDVSPLPAESVSIIVGSNNLNLMLSKELMVMTTAQIINNTAAIKLAQTQMQLSERLRKAGA